MRNNTRAAGKASTVNKPPAKRVVGGAPTAVRQRNEHTKTVVARWGVATKISNHNVNRVG